MVILNFIRGTIRGKIGQFVGSSWRGKGYIKTFTKPGNPRTADQRAVRSVFYNVSHIAKAIYNDVLKKYTFPKPRKQGTDRAIAVVYNSATGAVVFKTETRAAGFLDVSIAAMENPQSEDLHSYLVFVREPDPYTDEIGVCSETAYKK